MASPGLELDPSSESLPEEALSHSLVASEGHSAARFLFLSDARVLHEYSVAGVTPLSCANVENVASWSSQRGVLNAAQGQPRP